MASSDGLLGQVLLGGSIVGGGGVASGRGGAAGTLGAFHLGADMLGAAEPVGEGAGGGGAGPSERFEGRSQGEATVSGEILISVDHPLRGDIEVSAEAEGHLTWVNATLGGVSEGQASHDSWTLVEATPPDFPFIERFVRRLSGDVAQEEWDWDPDKWHRVELTGSGTHYAVVRIDNDVPYATAFDQSLRLEGDGWEPHHFTFDQREAHGHLRAGRTFSGLPTARIESRHLPAGDFDLRLDRSFALGDSGRANHAGFNFRASGWADDSVARPHDGYQLVTPRYTSDPNVYLHRWIGGSSEEVAHFERPDYGEDFSTGGLTALADWESWRIQAEGATIRIKAWRRGEAEPEDWGLVYVEQDLNAPSVGQLQFGVRATASWSTSRWMWMRVDNVHLETTETPILGTAQGQATVTGDLDFPASLEVEPIEGEAQVEAELAWGIFSGLIEGGAEVEADLIGVIRPLAGEIEGSSEVEGEFIFLVDLVPEAIEAWGLVEEADLDQHLVSGHLILGQAEVEANLGGDIQGYSGEGHGSAAVEAHLRLNLFLTSTPIDVSSEVTGEVVYWVELDPEPVDGSSEVPAADLGVYTLDPGPINGSSEGEGHLTYPDGLQVAGSPEGSSTVEAHLRWRGLLRPEAIEGSSDGEGEWTYLRLIYGEPTGSSQVFADLAVHLLPPVFVEGWAELPTANLTHDQAFGGVSEGLGEMYEARVLNVDYDLPLPHAIQGMSYVHGWEHVAPHDFDVRPIADARAMVEGHLGMQWSPSGTIEDVTHVYGEDAEGEDIRGAGAIVEAWLGLVFRIREGEAEIIQGSSEITSALLFINDSGLIRGNCIVSGNLGLDSDMSGIAQGEGHIRRALALRPGDLSGIARGQGGVGEWFEGSRRRSTARENFDGPYFIESGTNEGEPRNTTGTVWSGFTGTGSQFWSTHINVAKLYDLDSEEPVRPHADFDGGWYWSPSRYRFLDLPWPRRRQVQIEHPGERGGYWSDYREYRIIGLFTVVKPGERPPHANEPYRFVPGATGEFPQYEIEAYPAAVRPRNLTPDLHITPKGALVAEPIQGDGSVDEAALLVLRIEQISFTGNVAVVQTFEVSFEGVATKSSTAKTPIRRGQARDLNPVRERTPLMS